MQLVVNGEARDVVGAVTLAEYLRSLELRSPMVVVERNGVIVPRDTYADVSLADGDVLEIVQMMAGG